MRDAVAVVVLAVAALGVVAGLGYVTADLPAEAAPDASFEASDLEDPRFESGQRLVVR